METGERIGILRRAGLSRDGIAAALGIEPSQVAAYDSTNAEPDFRDVLQVYEFGTDIPLAAGWAPEVSAIRPPAGLMRIGDFVQGVGTLIWTPGVEGPFGPATTATEVVYETYLEEYGDPSWVGGLPDALTPSVRVRGVVGWALGGLVFENSGEAVMLQVNQSGQVLVGGRVSFALEAPLTLLLDNVRWLAL